MECRRWNNIHKNVVFVKTYGLITSIQSLLRHIQWWLHWISGKLSKIYLFFSTAKFMELNYIDWFSIFFPYFYSFILSKTLSIVFICLLTQKSVLFLLLLLLILFCPNAVQSGKQFPRFDPGVMKILSSLHSFSFLAERGLDSGLCAC
jgi:hypothetical protein